MGLLGIDVSANNGVIDWAKVKNSGPAGFVYAKATEGITYTDDQFRASHDGCKAHDIPFGAYHFFRSEDAPKEQAAHFLARINGYEGQLVPVVDVEENRAGLDKRQLSDAVLAFADTVSLALHCPVMLYSYYNFLENLLEGQIIFADMRLWIAEYDKGVVVPDMPNGWKQWDVWQKTDSGVCAGITGGVDLDYLNGYDLERIYRVKKSGA